MEICDPRAALIINVTKLYDAESRNTFKCYGRVFSGTVERGMLVKVVADGCVNEDDENLNQAVVDGVCLPGTEYVSCYCKSSDKSPI